MQPDSTDPSDPLDAVERFAGLMRDMFAVCGLGVLLIIITTPFLVLIPYEWVNNVIGWTTNVVVVFLFIYPILLMSWFMWRTRLLSYVLAKHWWWTSFILLVLWELLVVLIKRFAGYGIRVSANPWLVFLLIILSGLVLQPWRNRRFLAEYARNAELWHELIRMQHRDIALLRFPRAHTPANRSCVDVDDAA